jgi:hypothetical protein
MKHLLASIILLNFLAINAGAKEPIYVLKNSLKNKKENVLQVEKPVLFHPANFSEKNHPDNKAKVELAANTAPVNFTKVPLVEKASLLNSDPELVEKTIVHEESPNQLSISSLFVLFSGLICMVAIRRNLKA